MGLCLLEQGADAAPAARASTNNYCTGTPDGSGHVNCALGAAAVSGDTILACGRAGSSYDVTAVSDGTNGSYTLGTQFQGNGNVRSRCAWFINAASGTPTIQFTFNNVTGTAQIDVVAISGVATTGSAISETGSTSLGSSTTPTCASATATAANQILWAYLNADSNPTSVAPRTSETELHEDPTNHLTQLEYKLTSGSGSVSASWTLGSAAGAACNEVIFNIAASAPTYSVAPAIGTRTTSTLPFTQTTACTDCTAYGVAETDGLGTPTCTQIKAGQGADGNAAYKAVNGAATTAVQLTLTFSSYTDGTLRDGYFCLHSTANGDSAVSAIADMYKLPAFTTAITIASASATAYTTNSDVLDGAGSVYLAACKLGASAPSVAQVEAQTGGCIVNATTDNATGPFSLTITGTIFPAYDLYFVGTYGSQHEAAVHSLTGQCLSAPSGKQFINCPTGLTSIGVGSAIETLNAAITPDWAVGDIPVCDTFTHTVPSGTQQFAFHLSVAGFASYDSGDGSRTYANCDAYDLSVGAYATAANANNDLDWWDQDPAISCSPPFITVLKTNVAMSAAPNGGNITFTSNCTHPLGDTLTTALTSGTWPAGLALAANVLSGTATVENEAGAAETVTATSSVTGGTGAQALTLYPLTTVTVPNCVSSPTTEGNCRAAILAALHNAVTTVSTTAHSLTVAAGNVISMSPAQGAEIAPWDTETLTISSGGSGGRSHMRLRMGLSL
jgi:hypothetical protein